MKYYENRRYQILNNKKIKFKIKIIIFYWCLHREENDENVETQKLIRKLGKNLNSKDNYKILLLYILGQ